MAEGSTPETSPVASRGRIYDSIIDTIGATPLVRMSRLAAAHQVKATLLAKCEFFNPLSSVKDRIGAAMIEAAEKAGRITPGKTVLVEPTSGNTGIALAFVAAAKGYRCILVMPDSMSIERRRMLKLLGAELELTPAAQGMRYSIQRAEELVRSLPDAYMPQQFENPANPEIHRRTTAEEIWRDTDGKVDVMVCGTGTGGTLTGVASALKAKKPGLKMFAVEPEDSAVISGGPPGPHKIQGMGPGFIPKNLDVKQIDEILRMSNDTAIRMAREVARLEGMAVGISSGAAAAAAIEIGQRPEMAGKMIVVVLPDTGERYLSTALFDGLKPLMELSDAQFERYARHLVLDEVGEDGQNKLLATRVLVVGAGGLGSPVLLYLAAAGVGTLGVIDDDTVDLSNLQRQIVHATDSIGTAKVDSAKRTLASINPEVNVETHRARLTAANAAEIVAQYDLVADGSDNFATRYLLNDLCYRLKKPLVGAALSPFEGQLSTFKAYLGAPHPCYRCLFAEEPAPDSVPRCETAGILGAIAGVMGTLQATEVLKEILGLGESLSGALLVYDALRADFHRIKLPRDPDCATCGGVP